MLYTRCGLEVGVAASKTFTAQVALLSLIGLKLAQVRKTLPPDEIEFILDRSTSCREKMSSSSTATTRSTRSRSASTTSRSSSTSAATSACRSRSRAR